MFWRQRRNSITPHYLLWVPFVSRTRASRITMLSVLIATAALPPPRPATASCWAGGARLRPGPPRWGGRHRFPRRRAGLLPAAAPRHRGGGQPARSAARQHGTSDTVDAAADAVLSPRPTAPPRLATRRWRRCACANLPAVCPTGAATATVYTLRHLAQRIENLTIEQRQLQLQITTVLTPTPRSCCSVTAPARTAPPRCSPPSATTPIGCTAKPPPPRSAGSARSRHCQAESPTPAQPRRRPPRRRRSLPHRPQRLTR